MRPLQKLLLSAYVRVKDSGLLDGAIAQAAFIRAYFLYKRWLEDPYAALVRARPDLFASGDVFDVGANIGYTATVFAGALSPERRVWAFEPEARNFEILSDVIRSRSLEGRVEPVRAAVGREDGSVRLWINPDHPADHRVLTGALEARLAPGKRWESVPLVSLDSFASSRAIDSVGFVKIDVQGYELAVCQGMRRTLERNPSACIAVEHAPSEAREIGMDAGGVAAFFAARGYRAWVLDRRGNLSAADPDAEIQRTGRSYVDVVYARRVLV